MLKAGSTSIRKTAPFRCIPQYVPYLQQDLCPAGLPLAHAAALLPSFLVPAWTGLQSGVGQSQHIHTGTSQRSKRLECEASHCNSGEASGSSSTANDKLRSAGLRLRPSRPHTTGSTQMRGSQSHKPTESPVFMREEGTFAKDNHKRHHRSVHSSDDVKRRYFSTNKLRGQEVQECHPAEASFEVTRSASSFNDRFGSTAGLLGASSSHTSSTPQSAEDEAWNIAKTRSTDSIQQISSKGKLRQLDGDSTENHFHSVLRTTYARLERLANSANTRPSSGTPALRVRSKAIMTEDLVSILEELLFLRDGRYRNNPNILGDDLRHLLAKVLKISLGRTDSLLNSLIALKKDMDLVGDPPPNAKKVAAAIRDALLSTQIPDDAHVQVQHIAAEPSSSEEGRPLSGLDSPGHEKMDTRSFPVEGPETARKLVHTLLNRILTVHSSSFPFYSLSMIPALASFLVHLSPRTAISSFRTITTILRKTAKVNDRSGAPIVTPFHILLTLLSKPVASLSRKGIRSRMGGNTAIKSVIYTKYWQRVKSGPGPTPSESLALFQAAERSGELDLAVHITKTSLRQCWDDERNLVGDPMSAKTMVAKVSKAFLMEDRLKEAENLLKEVLTSHKGWRSDALLWQRRLQIVLARAKLGKDTTRILHDMHTLLSDLKKYSIRLDAYAISAFIHGLPKLDIPLEDAFRLLGLARSVPIMSSTTVEASQQVPSARLPNETEAHIFRRVGQEQRMVDLAAVVCDFELLDKARKAHVQVPWKPLAVSMLEAEIPSSRQAAILSMPAANGDVMQLKLNFSHAVLVHRLAIWRKDSDAAMQAYQSILTLRTSISGLLDGGFSFDPSTLALFSQLQQSALVRALSDALGRQDLQTAIRIVQLTMNTLGGGSIGHEVLRRLLTAACSPHFHRTPGLSGQSEPSVDASILLRVLAIIREWARHQVGGSGAPQDPRHERLQEAHQMQYVRQVFASPSILDRLVQAAILAFLPPAKAGESSTLDARERAIEGFRHVINTLRDLHSLDSKRWFWGRMQLHGEALDKWLHPEDLAKGAGWKQNQAALKGVIDAIWQQGRVLKPLDR